jgi:hypothetical protein
MRITLTPTNPDAINEAMGDIRRRVVDFSERAPVIAGEEYFSIVDEVFTTEGASIGQPWEPLARYTVQEREHFGYGGTNPILQREGYLRRSLMDPGMEPQTIYVRKMGEGGDTLEPHLSGNEAILENPREGDVVFRWGTVDDRFAALHYGSPPRPMVPGDDPKTHARIELKLLSYMERADG